MCIQQVATEVLALLPDAKYSSTSKSITVSAAGKRQKLLPGAPNHLLPQMRAQLLVIGAKS